MVFEFGPLAVRWYGLLIALAVLLGLVDLHPTGEITGT